MATAEMVTRPAPIAPATDWRGQLEMAGVLLKSGVLPRSLGTPEAVFAVMKKGQELGIPDMYALSNIVMIEGKPTAGSELMLALIYRDHGDNAIIVDETDETHCTVIYRRRAWPQPRMFSFSMEDARKAGLAGKQNWQKYPAAMLRARCISAVARLAFPDSIGGMYTPEELEAEVEIDPEGGMRPVGTSAVVVHEDRDFPKASPFKPASANQLATISKLARQLGHPWEPVELTSAEASERITELSREYTERTDSGRHAVAEKPARSDQRRYTPEQMAAAPQPGASDEQKDRLWALSRDLGISTRPDEFEGLTYADASRRIVDMEIALSQRSQEPAGTPELAPVDATKAHLLDEAQQRARTADETRSKADYQAQWPASINRLADATGESVGKLVNAMCSDLNLMGSPSRWTREEYAAAFAWVGKRLEGQHTSATVPISETI